MNQSSIPTRTANEETLPMLEPYRVEPAFGAPAADIAVDSARGTERARNEDHAAVAELHRRLHIRHGNLAGGAPELGEQGLLLAVADGMGGHVAGDVASSVAIRSFFDYAVDRLPWLTGIHRADDDTVIGELERAMRVCNERLRELADREGITRLRPGTTLTAAYVAWPVMFVVHVGDSRAYLLRDGILRRLTRDHTLAQRLAEDGDLDVDGGLGHVLYNALGGDDEVVMSDVERCVLTPGDTVVLCSDGIHGKLPDGDLADIVSQAPAAADACRRLVARALASGSRDDTTALVVRF